jgi:hypothetical protein
VVTLPQCSVQQRIREVKFSYPQNMTFTQWRRTPFRARHRLLGLMINNHFRYWRSCADARCRRARGCQDYLCYWRRLEKMPIDDAQRVRGVAGQTAVDRLHQRIGRPVAVLIDRPP